MTIRLLIADDHAILRAGLRMLVEAQSDMRVIAEATDGNETVTRVAEAKPDVVLLDLSMPKSTGLQAIPEIRRRCPRARVLVLSMYEDIAYVRAAFDAGAVGYVLKKAADAELLTAIRTVVGGKKYLCSRSQEVLAQSALGVDLTGADGPPHHSATSLSKREREVLIMVAQGYTNRQIAERLDLSVKSVESYRARVQEKLGLQTRVQLHRYALATGFLRADGLDEPDLPTTP
ncbi:MAG: response regulator transcription factor [Nitrospira sp.]|nr:response regulator transcription factor [Nitrospira sp.]